jgi:hypothetical protein
MHKRDQSKLSLTMPTTLLTHLLVMCVRSISKSKSLLKSPSISGPLSITSRNQRKALSSDNSRRLVTSAHLTLQEVFQLKSLYRISSQQSKASFGKLSKAPAIRTSCGGLQKCVMSKPLAVLEVCMPMIILIRSKRPVWHGVSPGYLVQSRGLSTGQSTHHFMYINLDHRPLGHNNTHFTSYFSSCS